MVMKNKNNGARKTVEKEIESMFGSVPGYFESVPNAALESAWGLQRDLEFGETALDARTKELIGLAMASHIKCKYCIYFHTKAARFHGASEEQLREAAAMGGLTVMFSNAITGAQTDYDDFKMDVDRALEHMASEHEPKTGKRSRAAAPSTPVRRRA